VLVTERKRESGGNVYCWLVKVQGLRVSDIVWGVEVCEGRTVGVMVVMVCCSYLCEGRTVNVMVGMVCCS